MFETIQMVIAVLVGLIFLGCLVAFVLFFVTMVLVMAGIGTLALRGGIAWGNNRWRDHHRRQATTAGENRRRYISGEYGHLIQH